MNSEANSAILKHQVILAIGPVDLLAQLVSFFSQLLNGAGCHGSVPGWWICGVVIEKLQWIKSTYALQH